MVEPNDYATIAEREIEKAKDRKRPHVVRIHIQYNGAPHLLNPVYFRRFRYKWFAKLWCKLPTYAHPEYAVVKKIYVGHIKTMASSAISAEM